MTSLWIDWAAAEDKCAAHGGQIFGLILLKTAILDGTNRKFKSRAPVSCSCSCSCSSEIKSKSTIKSKNVELNLRVFGVVQPRFAEI